MIYVRYRGNYACTDAVTERGACPVSGGISVSQKTGIWWQPKRIVRQDFSRGGVYMRLKFLAVSGLIWIAHTGQLHASQSDNRARAATNCRIENAITLPKTTVRTCTSDSMESELGRDDSTYYGVLSMDVSGGGTIKVNKDFGKRLRTILGIKDAFDASIVVTVMLQDIVVYERPMLVVKVDEKDGSQVSVNTTLANGVDITPFFPLQDQGPLQVQLRVVRIARREGKPVENFSKGIDLVGALGGGGWLLSAASNQAFLSAAAKAAGMANELYTSLDDTKATTLLNHRADGHKRVHYGISIEAGNGQPFIFVVEVYLRTTPSLITTKMRPPPDDYIPDVNIAGTTRDWASKILLQHKPEALYLSEYLEASGVPASLDALKVAPGLSAPVPKIDLVNSACEALRDALSGAPLRLSDSDRDLVLFSELKKRGVFDVYEPIQLRCLEDTRDAWASLYKLPMPSTQSIRDISEVEKNRRLDRLAAHWSIEDQVNRSDLLSKEDFTEQVSLTAVPNMLPGYPASVPANVATGMATWEIDPSLLGLLRKTCFGNQKANATTDRWQTAFAEFAGSSNSYLVTMHFKADESWGQSGPRIRALTMKPATSADVQNFDRNGKCLSGVTVIGP